MISANLNLIRGSTRCSIKPAWPLAVHNNAGQRPGNLHTEAQWMLLFCVSIDRQHYFIARKVSTKPECRCLSSAMSFERKIVTYSIINLFANRFPLFDDFSLSLCSFCSFFLCFCFFFVFIWRMRKSNKSNNKRSTIDSNAWSPIGTQYELCFLNNRCGAIRRSHFDFIKWLFCSASSLQAL